MAIEYRSTELYPSRILRWVVERYSPGGFWEIYKYTSKTLVVFFSPTTHTKHHHLPRAPRGLFLISVMVITTTSFYLLLLLVPGA